MRLVYERGNWQRRSGKRYAYLETADGVDLCAKMIEDGYARNYITKQHPRFEKYAALQKAAREAKRGLWADVGIP